MRDTKLTAPFDGSIEKRLVENYQRVNSGEGIVQLVNTQNLRIKFTIPDAYLYLLRAKDPRFLVEFDTFKGHVFKARPVSYTHLDVYKRQPLIGNAGVSAVPDSARISQVVGLEYDPTNYLLMHAMGPNVAGVIGSAVAAGILLGFLM